LSRKRPFDRKDAKKAEVASGTWSRCLFFQERKKRYCSIPRAPGSEWCGHHTPEHQAGARPRAPCPVDPTHTAWVDEMAAHAARCASAQQAAAAAAAPYYSKGVNAGGCCAGEAAAVAALRAAAAAAPPPPPPPPPQPGGAGEHAPPRAPGRSRGCGALERLFSGAVPSLDVPALCHALLAFSQGAPQPPLRALCAAPRGVAHLRAALATTLGGRAEAPPPQGALPAPAEEAAAVAALRLAGRSLFRHELQQVSIVSSALGLGQGLPPAGGCAAGGGGGGGAFGMEVLPERAPARDAVFVEFGAGSGKLSFTVDRLAAPVRLLLLDRGAMRSKGDREVRRAATAAAAAAAAAGGDGSGEEGGEGGGGGGSALTRARIDIADVDLATLLDARDDAAGDVGGAAPARAAPAAAVVALGKHVCGAATDFTLRAVARACAPCGERRVAALAGDGDGDGGDGGEGPSLPPPAPPRHRLQGLSIALCCHHACDWPAFVGKRWWREEFGQSAAAFEAARFLSSWALLEEWRGEGGESCEGGGGGGGGGGACADAPAPPPLAAPLPPPPPPGQPAAAGAAWAAALTTQQRAAIGRAAKRAINEGRLRFLAAAFHGAPGVAPRLAFYVPLRVSLENVLLAA